MGVGGGGGGGGGVGAHDDTYTAARGAWVH